MASRRAPLVVCLVVIGCLLMVRSAAAGPIGLGTPFTGTSATGGTVGLTVSYDSNGSFASNLVGLELYVAFTGLTPVAGSYQLGSVFTPFLVDVMSLDGLCADMGCNYPADDQFSSETYLSLVSVFAPSEPSGPGGLFTLLFAASPGSSWTLNLFGDDGSGLLWDPPAQPCAPDDAACDPDPAIGLIPYSIARAIDPVENGIARVDVGVTPTYNPDPGTDPNPVPVPEPASLVLFGSGLATAALRLRRRRQP